MNQSPPGHDALLTVAQVAAILQANPKRLYRLIRAGALPGVRIGTSVRVSRERLDAWIRAGGSDARDPQRERT